MNLPCSGLTRRSVLHAALPLLLCGRPAIAGTIADGAGVSVTADAPRRIVSVGSSVTEIIVGFGLASAIAAIDSTSLGVPGAAGLPNVGYMRSLSAEGVLSQSPDLVCATSDSGPPEVLDALRASGVPLALIPHVPTVDGILAKIALMGTLLDRQALAAAMAGEVAARAAALKAEVARVASRPRVLFILSLADHRLLAGGAGTAADAVIAMAGGMNLAAPIRGYKPLATEFLLTNPPDAVVMMTGTGPAPTPGDVFALPGLAGSPAAAGNALHMFDGAYLLGFGPRTIAAAGELAALLHPGLAP